MKKLFAFLFFVSIVSAGICVDDPDAGLLSPTSRLYLGIAFGITFMVIALAYAGSKFTNNPKLTVFYKEEFFHLIISVVLLVSIGGVMTLSCTVVSGFMEYSGLVESDANVSPQLVAKGYVSQTVREARLIFTYLIKDSITYEMDSAYVFGLYNPLTGGITMGFKGYKKAYAMELDMMAMTYVMPVIVSLESQKVLINFSVDIVKYLLPVALFLRIFTPTRMAGNYLIAICIALYIVIPTMYAINGAMYDVAKDSCIDIGDNVFTSQYSYCKIGSLIPQAFFLPNLTLAIVITFLSGINKALRVLG